MPFEDGVIDLCCTAIDIFGQVDVEVASDIDWQALG